jgi:protein-disulfide isomerase
VTKKRESDDVEARGTAAGEPREVEETEATEGEAREASARDPEAPEGRHRAEGGRSSTKKKRAKSGGSADRHGSAKGARAASAEPEPEAKPAGGGRLLLVALVTLAMGLVVGWFGRDAQGSVAPASVTSAPAPSGSAAAGGVCDQWSAAVCKEAGDTAEACEQARAGAKLLPDGACQSALQQLPTTLERVKGARSLCDSLVTKLCADLGPESQSCKLVKEKTPGMPASQCEEMMGSYGEVLGELQKMEKQNAPLTVEVAAAQAAGDGPSFGPPNAKVTVIEYSDFECPYCSRAASVVQQLKKKYSDRVRFVFRQFPLPMHRNAALAAQAALAAHAQGKFWELHDKMFANQRALDRESLEGYAKDIGLDLAKFKKALDDSSYDAAVKADIALGEQIGVSGTPTMIINTQRVPNATDFASVSAMIDGELAAAK